MAEDRDAASETTRRFAAEDLPINQGQQAIVENVVLEKKSLVHEAVLWPRPRDIGSMRRTPGPQLELLRSHCHEERRADIGGAPQWGRDCKAAGLAGRRNGPDVAELAAVLVAL